MKKAVPIILAMSIVSACANPERIDVRKIGDDKMSCSELKDAYNEADQFEQKARKEKGVTGTNVAAAVFFWPSLLATYSNVEDAIGAAKNRKAHLVRIADKKNCSI